MKMPFRNTAIGRSRLALALVAVGITGVAWSQEEPPAIEIDPPDLDVMEMIEGLDIDPQLLEQLANVLGEDGNVGMQVEADIMEDFAGMALGGRMRAGGITLSQGMVKTDTNAEELLERAEQFGKQGRYDLASQLWQQAIDQSSGALLSREDWQQRTFAGNTYRQMRPMLDEIEASMGRSISDNLADYQLKIDGDARALLARATPETRESALSEVVLRYFLSSIGDDAAFELGCLKMERGEFLPAVRLFSKILDEYPQTGLDPIQVQIRLAGSLARVGSGSQALEMVAALYAQHPAQRRILTLVREDIEAVLRDTGDSMLTTTTLRTPMQVQTTIPGRLPATLGVAWKQTFDLTLPQEWAVLPESPRSPLPEIVNPFMNHQQARQRNQPGQGAPPLPARLEDRWRSFFMPAGQMLVRDGTTYFKTDDRLVACDTSSGSLKWLGFRHGLVIDENTSLSAGRLVGGTTMNTVPYPTSAEEILLFGDRIHQALTLSGDTIYCLQGNPLDFEDEKPEVKPMNANDMRMRQMQMAGRGLPGRFRENRLVAYHATSGKLLWYRRAEEPADPNFPMMRRAGYANAPVPYGSLLLVPVHEESALWLAGLNRQTGETVWRTFLCDEPMGQCEGFSPVPISVDAGEAYVGSGAGLLFSVDAISGQLNWSVTYPRTAITSVATGSEFVPNYAPYSRLLDGWREDRVLPHGNEVMVVGTDFNHAFAVNRRTGKLAWEAKQQPFRATDSNAYVLAVHSGRLYVAGQRSVRCYQSHGGKLMWEATLPDSSHARGAFTPEAIYIPLERSVVQLDPETGKQVAQAQVPLSNEDEPIGNLYSDGKRLVVFGLKQVYGLSPISSSETLN